MGVFLHLLVVCCFTLSPPQSGYQHPFLPLECLPVVCPAKRVWDKEVTIFPTDRCDFSSTYCAYICMCVHIYICTYMQSLDGPVHYAYKPGIRYVVMKLMFLKLNLLYLTTQVSD